MGDYESRNTEKKESVISQSGQYLDFTLLRFGTQVVGCIISVSYFSYQAESI